MIVDLFLDLLFTLGGLFIPPYIVGKSTSRSNYNVINIKVSRAGQRSR